MTRPSPAQLRWLRTADRHGLLDRDMPGLRTEVACLRKGWVRRNCVWFVWEITDAGRAALARADGEEDQEMAKSKRTVAYKAFEEDLTCRGFQYEFGGTYETDHPVRLCADGFHAVLVPFDAWDYYPGATTLARVELSGAIDGPLEDDEEDSKLCAQRIKVGQRLNLAAFIRAQVKVVTNMCGGMVPVVLAYVTRGHAATNKDHVAAVNARDRCGHAATTGFNSHAVTVGRDGHAASVGEMSNAASAGARGHAAATGYRSSAVAMGYTGHAFAEGDYGHAVATGIRGSAVATGEEGHAAAVGDDGSAVAKGYKSHAVSMGHKGSAFAKGVECHAVATARQGRASVAGVDSVAFAPGLFGFARASEGGWIVLAAYDDEGSVTGIKAARAGDEVKPDTWYRINAKSGQFEEIER